MDKKSNKKRNLSAMAGFWETRHETCHFWEKTHHA